MGFCSSKSWVLLNRNLFTAAPYFSAGVGADELLRGISTNDILRLLAALGLMFQGLFASYIFIRNGISGQGWKCRSFVFFMVGGITGLLIGLLIYYPLALDLSRQESIHHEDVEEPTTDRVMANITDGNGSQRIPRGENLKIVSKLWYLVPNLALSLLVLVNTVYGLSVKLEAETRTSQPDACKEEELVTIIQGNSQVPVEHDN